eukprot:s5941_g6.t1
MAAFRCALAMVTVARLHAQEFAIGAYGPATSQSQSYIAVVASFDLDLRKNFETALQARFGPPIIPIPNLHPNISSVRVRMGTSHSQPDVGVETALDFMFGSDGETPVSALVGGVFSSIAIPVASVSAVRKVPQIAWAASSPALSNKDSYPYFLRTAPPDSIQGRAFWNWIVAFEVPSATCLYASEPYGRGLFLAMEELAKLAGQEGRVKGVSVRYMPNNFVLAEAEEALTLVRNLGSRFLFTAMILGNSQMFTSFAPVLRSEGMLGPGWQLLGSESAMAFGTETGRFFWGAYSRVDFLDSELPVGFMRWNPVDRGPKFPDYAALWQKMDLNDVDSPAARGRYGTDNYKVPFLVPPMTQEEFTNVNIPVFGTFLFDALYTIVLAANSLLNQGIPLADIKGSVLLDELKQTAFMGVTGDIEFDANGDRLASYELLVSEPVSEGGPSSPTRQVVGAIFSASTGQLTMESNQCKACPRGFFCLGGTQPYLQCPRGSFANETGMVNCTRCPLGHFAGEVGSSSCSPCQAGFYANALGLEACLRCEKGTYVSEVGAHRCTSCGMMQVTDESGAQTAGDCKCAEGAFMCSGMGCLACPEGLFCESGLGPPTQLPGFWTAFQGPGQCSFKVLRCRGALQCPRNPLGACADGREGLACNNCKEGHYPLEEGSCKPCVAGDALPAILCTIVVAIVVMVLFSCVNADMNQQSLNIITVATVGSQMVTAIQALGSIRQLSINWVEPVRQLIDLTGVLTFDFDMIRISCLVGQDSPTLKFLCQLLICPMGSCLLLATWAIARLRGRRVTLDSLFNMNGIIIFAFFITLGLAVLGPFQCVKNPDGSSSMASNPGIICYSSAEHWVLILLSITGIICYPIAILVWATYTTVMYPIRIASGKGLQLVNRYRFLFQRFRPECYYYGLLLLFRNAFIALFPVAFVQTPEIQVLLMGALFVLGSLLQVRTWPWRTEAANFADAIMTGFLLVVLLGAAPLSEVEKLALKWASLGLRCKDGYDDQADLLYVQPTDQTLRISVTDRKEVLWRSSDRKGAATKLLSRAQACLHKKDPFFEEPTSLMMLRAECRRAATHRSVFSLPICWGPGCWQDGDGL